MTKKHKNIEYLLKVAYKEDKGLFVLSVLNSFVISLKPLLYLAYPKIIITSYELGKDFGVVIQNLIYVSISLTILSYIQSIFSAKISSRLLNLRLVFFEKYTDKCMDMKYEYTENREALNRCAVASRAIESSSGGIEGIYNGLNQLGQNILVLIVYSVILSTLSYYIVFILFVSSVIQNILIYKGKKYEHSFREKISESFRKKNYLENTMIDFGYGKEIRLNNLKSKLIEKYRKTKIGEMTILKDIQGKYLLYHNVNLIINLLTNLFFLILVINKISNGTLLLSSFIVYLQSIASFGVKLNSVVQNLIEIKKEDLLVTKYREFLDLDSVEDKSKERIVTGGDIEFENISFSYPNSNIKTIKNISLLIKEGEKIAIVGPNGAGKTTFVKLLMKLYEPTEGRIKYGGSDIKKMGVKEYHNLFSTIFQECLLLAFTIRENIGLGIRNNVDKAIELSGLREKVDELPRGLETHMTKYFEQDGVEFSGGEKQKLMIARAINKDGDIFVLDEPTSALDPIAEGRIYEDFAKMVKNKTALFISHRLASTKFCDRIIYLNNGRIEEVGSHKELMELNSEYANMYNIQARNYK